MVRRFGASAGESGDVTRGTAVQGAERVTALDDFMTRIRADYAGREPARAELEALGRALHTLCATFPFDATLHRLARAGEALMAELDVDPRGGPSLYLVSDGEGVDTVPHHHQTWAVILGIRGEEFNVFHVPTGDGQGRVVTCGEARVGPGDVLVMEAHEIHAIDSRRGVHPTYHVHLYGRALAALPSFASRCHAVD